MPNKNGYMRPRTIACAVCENPFVTQHSMAKYCSLPCARRGASASYVKYRKSNPQVALESTRRYRSRNRAFIRARAAERAKSPKGREANRRRLQRELEHCPERIFARQVVRAAVLSGFLIRQPCRICGEARSEAHHADYATPLIVDWLCNKHHREVDAAMRKVGIPRPDAITIRLTASEQGFVIEDGSNAGDGR